MKIVCPLKEIVNIFMSFRRRDQTPEALETKVIIFMWKIVFKRAYL